MSADDVMEVLAAAQAAFVLPAVAAARRVLEVGCGRGRLAARLAAAGHDTTAIDKDFGGDVPAHAGVAFVEADLLGFDAPPFDAVVFTASLHHIAPLDAALDRARALLAPGGALVVDDFDLDAPDARTLTWYYELQRQLAAQGRLDAAHLDHEVGRDVLARWRHAHAPHDGESPLHAGAAMLAAIRARFADARVTRGPYLWRRVARGTVEPALADAIRAAEVAGLELGLLRQVGLQIVATRP